MRLRWLTVLGAIGVAATSVATAADSFTVGVLSCAAETDRDRRLECYDRAVAGYTAGLAGGKRDAATGAPPPGVPSPGVAPGRSTAAVAAIGSTAVGGSAPGPAGTGSTAAAVPRHVAARIASVEHFPDYVVVHLDNQQIWKQVSDSPGAPVLRNGDAVTIDRQMGSYWLAGPKGEAVQVRLEAPKP